MQPKRTVFCSEERILPLSTKAKLVSDDEVSKYMQRVEQARAELERTTGQKITPHFEVRTIDLFDVNSKANPF